MTHPKKPSVKPSKAKNVKSALKRPLISMRNKSRAYLSGRTHRSFRLTKRRDYKRALTLPKYWAFTNSVRKTLWSHRKLFFLLAGVYALLTAVLVGIASQDTYTAITDSIRQSGSDIAAGNGAALGNAVTLVATAVSGGLTQTLTAAQSTYAGIIVLLTWLTTVWLLRNILAGHKVKLRDGLYNGSAPILSTFLLVVVLVLQLLPMAIAFIGYSAAVSSGLLNGGVEAMLFWIAAGLLVVFSMYLITSTFIALVIVTLPGMYPMRALRTASELVVGRRMRILLRILWLVGIIVMSWIIVMVPIVLLDTWIKGLWPAIDFVPTIPVAILIMSSLTFIWSSAYIYLLYRRIVSDDADAAK